MITREKIEIFANDFLRETDLYVFEVNVKNGNLIIVTIDSDKVVTIDNCIALSRAIEKSLDRDIEDFELRVTSFGADSPLKFLRQYKKNIGRELDIKMKDDTNEKGKLIEVNRDSIIIERIFNKKKSEEIETNRILKFDDIKEARIILSFK